MVPGVKFGADIPPMTDHVKSEPAGSTPPVDPEEPGPGLPHWHLFHALALVLPRVLSW